MLTDGFFGIFQKIRENNWQTTDIESGPSRYRIILSQKVAQRIWPKCVEWKYFAEKLCPKMPQMDEIKMFHNTIVQTIYDTPEIILS